jgi:hypothetical protein
LSRIFFGVAILPFFDMQTITLAGTYLLGVASFDKTNLDQSVSPESPCFPPSKWHSAPDVGGTAGA